MTSALVDRLGPLLQISEDQVQRGEQIGKGGFGVVCKGLYQGQLVAIKTLKIPDTASSKVKQQIIQDFTDEADKLRRLEHPHIVRMLGCITSTFSIVLEYMPLGSLADYIHHSSGAIPWIDRFHIAMDISTAMAYLHAKVDDQGKKKPDVFHQDLKSANVLLTFSQDRLFSKVSDFGLSVLRDRKNATSSIITKSATNSIESAVPLLGGTAVYMAPELLSKQANRFTKACDVYAFGVILYEIATLKSPLQFRVIRKDLLKQDPKPSELYGIMWACTNTTASTRPCFAEVVTRFQKNKTSFEEFDRDHPILKTAELDEYEKQKETSSKTFSIATQHPNSAFNSENIPLSTINKSKIKSEKTKRTSKGCGSKRLNCTTKQKSIVALVTIVLGAIILGVILALSTIVSKKPSYYAVPSILTKNNLSLSLNDSTVNLLASWANDCNVSSQANGFAYFGCKQGTFLRISVDSSQPVQVFPSNQKEAAILAMDIDSTTGFVCVLWSNGYARIQNILTHYYRESRITWFAGQAYPLVACSYPNIFVLNGTLITRGSWFYYDDFPIQWSEQPSQLISRPTALLTQSYVLYLGTDQGRVSIRTVSDYINIGSQRISNSGVLFIKYYFESVFIFLDDGTMTTWRIGHPQADALQVITAIQTASEKPQDISVHENFIYILFPSYLVWVPHCQPSLTVKTVSFSIQASRMVILGGYVYISGKEGIYTVKLLPPSIPNLDCSFYRSNYALDLVTWSYWLGPQALQSAILDQGILYIIYANSRQVHRQELGNSQLIYEFEAPHIPLALSYDVPARRLYSLSYNGSLTLLYYGNKWTVPNTDVTLIEAQKEQCAVLLTHGLRLIKDDPHDFLEYTSTYNTTYFKWLFMDRFILGTHSGHLSTLNKTSLQLIPAETYPSPSRFPVKKIGSRGIYVWVWHEDGQWVKYKPVPDQPSELVFQHTFTPSQDIRDIVLQDAFIYILWMDRVSVIRAAPPFDTLIYYPFDTTVFIQPKQLMVTEEGSILILCHSGLYRLG